MTRFALVCFTLVSMAVVSGCAESHRLTITVAADGTTTVHGRKVDRGALERQMRDAVAHRGLRLVYVRADDDLSVAEIWDVVRGIRSAGVPNVGMAYVD